VSSPKRHFFVFFPIAHNIHFSWHLCISWKKITPKRWKHTTVTPFRVSHSTAFQRCACLSVP
jgi:hypothetical protein